MVLDNSNSPYHIEEELWLQILSLSRELQECKASLHHNTLDCISDKIEGIEENWMSYWIFCKGGKTKRHHSAIFYDNLSTPISYPII